MTMQFRFANYTFDPGHGLSYDGQQVHLPPKEKGVLQMLLSARGQVVRKDELVAHLWGNNETSDESISRTIYRLRVAMQSSGGPEVVETIYNSGFRITVPIRASNPQAFSSITGLTQSLQPNAVAALISAREFLARRTSPDIDAAANAARMALALDPTFSAAWSTLAEVRVFQAQRCLRPPREAGWMAKEAAQSALRIDPESAGALALRGWVRVMVEQEGEQGLQDLDHAFGCDPDYWLVTLLRGWALQAAGRHAESVAMLRQTLELNMMGHSVNATLAMFLLLAGAHDEALVQARSLAERFSTIDEAQGIAAIVCSVHRLHEEAAAYGWKAMELAPNTSLMHTPLAYALAHAGRFDEARSVLSAIAENNLPEPSACTAAVYLAMGERDKAIQKLTDACERGIVQFAWTRDDPRFAALRGDPVVEGLWSRIWNGTPVSNGQNG